MRLFVGALAFSATFSVAAAAAIMTFDSFTEFEAVSGTLETENFESVSSERNFTNQARRVGDFSLKTDLRSVADLASFNRVLIGPNYPSVFLNAATKNSIDGLSNYAHIGLRNGDVFSMVFSEPMYKFGADFKGLNDGFQRTVFSIDGTVVNISSTPTPTRRFLGFISDTPFTTISFRGAVIDPAGVADSEGFGIDNVVYSNEPLAEIPVPASLPLIASGLALLSVLKRRRKAIS